MSPVVPADAGLVVERADGIVRITLDRPEVKNALGEGTFRALADTIAEIGRSEDDRVVVIAGAGGVFSSGGELPPRRPGEPVPAPAPMAAGLRLMQQVVGEAMLAVFRCPKPVIAAVDGAAVGAGFSLVLACDLVVATEGSRFAFPFVARGLGLDSGASWTLPRMVGLHKAKELALLGDWVTAQEAASLGIVNRVVPAAELDQSVTAWASRMAAQSPTALTLVKQSLNRSTHTSLADAVDIEGLTQVITTRSGEARW